jgi:hypothetical protein
MLTHPKLAVISLVPYFIRFGGWQLEVGGLDGWAEERGSSGYEIWERISRDGFTKVSAMMARISSLFCEIANFGSVWICVDSIPVCAILIIRDVFHWIVSCSGDAAPVLFVIR